MVVVDWSKKHFSSLFFRSLSFSRPAQKMNESEFFPAATSKTCIWTEKVERERGDIYRRKEATFLFPRFLGSGLVGVGSTEQELGDALAKNPNGFLGRDVFAISFVRGRKETRGKKIMTCSSSSTFHCQRLFPEHELAKRRKKGEADISLYQAQKNYIMKKKERKKGQEELVM